MFVVALEYHGLQAFSQLFVNDVVAQFRRVLRLIFCGYVNHLGCAFGAESGAGHDKVIVRAKLGL